MSINMFLSRAFDHPLTVADVRGRAAGSDWCYALHKVDWRGSFLAAHGRSLICWFEAVDAESVRIALRQSGADTQSLWPGTVHEAPEPTVPNVLVERSFQDPVTFEEIRSVANASNGCFRTHRVKHVRTFLSLDGKRMVCFYNAPDAESVRITQREAALPVDTVCAFHFIGPDTLQIPRLLQR